jgi:hypothetical protein
MRIENTIRTPRPAKEKIALIIRSIIMMCVVIVVMMQLDTNSVMREVRSAFFCPDYHIADFAYDPEVDNDPNINYVVYEDDTLGQNIYAFYNVTRYIAVRFGNTVSLDQINIDLKLHRLFAWHNFKRGKLWMAYTLELTKKDGEHINASSWYPPTKLTIERVNGVWSVTDIDEPP